MPLNDLLCRNSKIKHKSYKLYDAGGLYLEISPSGNKYWFYKYRFDGKEKRLALGSYPAIPLLEARTLHEQARNQRKRGEDPVTIKLHHKQKEAGEKAETFEKIAREWLDGYKSNWKPKYADEVMRRFEKNLFPKLGNTPIRKITTDMLHACLKKVELRAPHMAKRLKQKCLKVFQYAKRKKKVEVNIAIDLDGEFIVKRPVHRPSIDIDELPEFLTALENGKENLSPITYFAIKIMLKTFQRRSELLHAQWHEIDFNRAIWTIPGKRMKMDNEHLVPLPSQTIGDLKALFTLTGNRKYLFPSFTNPNRPTRLTIISEGLAQIGFKGRMCAHGFRALAMGVCMERLKYRFEVPDRQLAHVPENEIRRAYDRAKFLDERIEMMQAYADYLDDPTQTQPPTERTSAYDRKATAITTPQSYPSITTHYRIYQSFGSLALPRH